MGNGRIIFRMVEFENYRVVVGATNAGGQKIEVFPPPPLQITKLLHARLKQCAAAAKGEKEVQVVKPIDIVDAEHGDGTRFLVIHGAQTSTLKWLGQKVVEGLGAGTGHWVDLTHSIEPGADDTPTGPLVEDTVANSKYL